MITNRDLVNEMSNDEVAELMLDKCEHCVYDNKDCGTGYASCEIGHALWLAAEAEPDKTEKFCADCIYFSDERPIKECIECTNKANYKRAVKLENCSEDVVDNDPVNHPSHYCKGGIECIDAIEAAVSNLVGIEAVCTANAIKYLWRWKEKNGRQDLEKAEQYIRFLLGDC
jgi:hypothetical protein